MDALCSHLQDRLQFSPGERDAIFLQHSVGIDWPDSIKVSSTHQNVRAVTAVMCVTAGHNSFQAIMHIYHVYKD